MINIVAVKRPLLEITDLSKKYPPPSGQVLFNINLTLYPKDIVALIGPSGAGKTTLANLVAGLDYNYAGSIKVLGKELTSYKSSSYRRQYVGMIFQKFYLIPTLNVYENVELPLKIAKVPKKKRKTEVINILKSVDMWDHHKKYPNQLSGGQAQRVAIARALVKKPKIILADEPTGNLDTKTGKKIVDLIKKLTLQINGVAIVITHDTEVIKSIPSRIYLRDGKIVKTENLS